MYDMYPEWGPAKHRTDDTNQSDQLGIRPDGS